MTGKPDRESESRKMEALRRAIDEGDASGGWHEIEIEEFLEKANRVPKASRNERGLHLQD
jgi:hypothetical protein